MCTVCLFCVWCVSIYVCTVCVGGVVYVRMCVPTWCMSVCVCVVSVYVYERVWGVDVCTHMCGGVCGLCVSTCVCDVYVYVMYGVCLWCLRVYLCLSLSVVCVNGLYVRYMCPRVGVVCVSLDVSVSVYHETRFTTLAQSAEQSNPRHRLETPM